MFRRVLIVWVAILGMLCPVRAALLASDVISRARTYLSDQATNANRQYFTDSTMLGWVNDGQREANAINWVFQASMTVTLVSGTAEYALPTEFMATQRVWLQPTGGTYTKLDGTSMDQLDAQTPGWTQATGTPVKYYVDRSSSTAAYLGVYPTPTSTSTGTLIVYYVQNATDLTTSSQQPFNGWNVLQPYVSSLSYYLAYRGFLSLEETDLANQYLVLWQNGLTTMRQGLYRQPDFNPPAAGNRGP